MTNLVHRVIRDIEGLKQSHVPVTYNVLRSDVQSFSKYDTERFNKLIEEYTHASGRRYEFLDNGEVAYRFHIAPIAYPPEVKPDAAERASALDNARAALARLGSEYFGKAARSELLPEDRKSVLRDIGEVLDAIEALDSCGSV